MDEDEERTTAGRSCEAAPARHHRSNPRPFFIQTWNRHLDPEPGRCTADTATVPSTRAAWYGHARMNRKMSRLTRYLPSGVVFVCVPGAKAFEICPRKGAASTLLDSCAGVDVVRLAACAIGMFGYPGCSPEPATEARDDGPVPRHRDHEPPWSMASQPPVLTLCCLSC